MLSSIGIMFLPFDLLSMYLHAGVQQQDSSPIADHTPPEHDVDHSQI